jgi:translation initiation factor IF-3
VKYLRLNDRIIAKTLRLIGPEGEQLGIFTRDLALKKSREYELDLVEVAPDAVPPVCRVMDFTKYLYDMKKKDREAKKHQKQTQLKEVRLTPRIDEHDFETKLKHVKEFLNKKHKVRIRIVFRGRELAHKEFADRLLVKVLQETVNIGKIDRDAHMLGKSLLLILCPK